ncbi:MULTISPECIES: hypothetical protein [Galbibacter]|uniref:Uncharacterized protein n=1 Tax=Galbibacter pacificus TaxID=2996052 RepID=A0ABT6FP56_9FLAO|nr:hypothetical protein [Galbibacter pacificus]MDG3581366.1 hypothetical protein [Galbibacter pacificus]MDG3584844.1 hypothetical protein [Galbibacter pacificus]
MKASYHLYGNRDESYIKFLNKTLASLKKDEYTEECRKQLKFLIDIYQLNAKLQNANNRFTKKYCAYCIEETERFIQNFQASAKMKRVVWMLKKLIKNCENVIGASTVIQLEEKQAYKV